MKMEIRMKRKKVSRKKAEEMIGKGKLEERIIEAEEVFAQEPETSISWMDGMEIIFR